MLTFEQPDHMSALIFLRDFKQFVTAAKFMKTQLCGFFNDLWTSELNQPYRRRFFHCGV